MYSQLIKFINSQLLTYNCLPCHQNQPNSSFIINRSQYMSVSRPKPTTNQEECRPGKTPVYTYQLAGSQIHRRTQTSNLLHKVLSAQESCIPLEGDQLKVEDQSQEQQRGQYRYFKSNVRCFRCKKIGHHNYFCLYQTSCQLCLSVEHTTDKCPQKIVCYQCHQWGHINSSCQSALGTYCPDCRRKHHRQCCFLTKGTEAVKQLFQTDYLNHLSSVRCMSCLGYGHLSCGEDFLLEEMHQSQKRHQREKLKYREERGWSGY